MGIFKTTILATTVVGVAAVSAKLQKKKRDGRLTSISTLFTQSLPTMIKMRRLAKTSGVGAYRKKINSPSFRLSDHWKCRDTDVLLSIPAKAGSTWCNHMCHQIRVGGDPNTNYNQDLLDVIPWLDQNITSVGQKFDPIPADPAAGPGAYDMDADHAGTDIRCFKTHLTWSKVKDLHCRKIYIYRATVDVLYSMARFRNIIFGSEDDPRGFINLQIMRGVMEEQLINLCDFWEHRNEKLVGFFFYDHLKEDHAGSVERLARAMGITPTKELVDAVVEQSTVSFMSANEHHLRFDGFRQLARIEGCRLDKSKFPEVSGQAPRGEWESMKVVQNGGLSSQTSSKKKKPAGREDVERCFQITWDKIVLPRTGFSDPLSMQDAWKTELSK